MIIQCIRADSSMNIFHAQSATICRFVESNYFQLVAVIPTLSPRSFHGESFAMHPNLCGINEVNR